MNAFVDGIIFAKELFVLPEVLSFDEELIQNIRNVSRVSVTACALALHACSTAKVGVGILSSNSAFGEDNDEKKKLINVLTMKFESKNELIKSVSSATIKLCKGMK